MSVTGVLLVVYIFWVYSSKASIIDSLSDEVETQRKDFTRKVAIFEEQSGDFAREIEDFELFLFLVIFFKSFYSEPN